jgi:hypothetical protein
MIEIGTSATQPTQQQHNQAAAGQQAAAAVPAQQQQEQQQQQAGRLVQRAAGNRTHFCVVCLTPIAVYGRLLPCMHTFCLACATDMPQCRMCVFHLHRFIGGPSGFVCEPMQSSLVQRFRRTRRPLRSSPSSH